MTRIRARMDRLWHRRGRAPGGLCDRPHYKRPAVPSPRRSVGRRRRRAVSLADAPWWEIFRDPILKDLIQEALRNNYDVRIAAARVQEPGPISFVSRSDLFPSLDYSAGVSRGKSNPASWQSGRPGPETSNFYSATVACPGSSTSGPHPWSTEAARRPSWPPKTPARRVADAGQRTGAGVLRAPGSRRAAPGRPGQPDAYQHTFDLFQDRFNAGRCLEARDVSGPGGSRRSPGKHPQLESAIVAKENQISILLGKNPGPILRGRPMYEQPVVRLCRGVAVGAPGAAARSPPGGATARELQRAHRCCQGRVLPKLSLTGLFGTASPRCRALTGGTATIWASPACLADGPPLVPGPASGRFKSAVLSGSGDGHIARCRRESRHSSGLPFRQPVSLSFGRTSALATPMRALKLSSSCSAWRRSGPDPGAPTHPRAQPAPRVARTSACHGESTGVLPSRMLIGFSSRTMALSSCGMFCLARREPQGPRLLELRGKRPGEAIWNRSKCAV